MGNRIQKRIYSAGNDRPPVVTRYVHDAQGHRESTRVTIMHDKYAEDQQTLWMQIVSSLHGADYYGTSLDGTVNVYTNNGWNTQPYIMKLTDLTLLYPDYGTPRGMNRTSGFDFIG